MTPAIRAKPTWAMTVLAVAASVTLGASGAAWATGAPRTAALVQPGPPAGPASQARQPVP
jgi:hypothetical protein